MRPKGKTAKALLTATLVLAALSAQACGGDDEGGSTSESGGTGIDASSFSAKVDNPFFPLSKLRYTLFEGSERSDAGKTIKTRGENRILRQPDRIAGIPVTVVDVREYENGKLVEHTLDYYAQRRDGSVWYVGEHVDDYENGKISGHGGEWIAGEKGAKPGLFMPADPKVGDKFEQERAPGVAEDRSEVVDVGLEVETKAGRFDDCIRTSDYAPLDKSRELKYYCRGIGMVREEKPGGRGRFDLVKYDRAKPTT